MKRLGVVGEGFFESSVDAETPKEGSGIAGAAGLRCMPEVIPWKKASAHRESSVPRTAPGTRKENAP
ncbi:hypothetical protein [Streptomyces sp. NPDC058751]|uniref:hypothetical protein n=1 Tax=Streptomyces sp. NPDC058751 TaxID=3346623 RepID=UPI003689B667